MDLEKTKIIMDELTDFFTKIEDEEFDAQLEQKVSQLANIYGVDEEEVWNIQIIVNQVAIEEHESEARILAEEMKDTKREIDRLEKQMAEAKKIEKTTNALDELMAWKNKIFQDPLMSIDEKIESLKTILEKMDSLKIV